MITFSNISLFFQREKAFSHPPFHTITSFSSVMLTEACTVWDVVQTKVIMNSSGRSEERLFAHHPLSDQILNPSSACSDEAGGDREDVWSWHTVANLFMCLLYLVRSSRVYSRALMKNCEETKWTTESEWQRRSNLTEANEAPLTDANWCFNLWLRLSSWSSLPAERLPGIRPEQCSFFNFASVLAPWSSWAPDRNT